MSLSADTVLAAIGFTETSDFNDVCRGLGADVPTERGEWREFFTILEGAERQGLVEIERVEGKIDTVQLTEAGAAVVRAKLDQQRGLFGIEGV
jgi:hypothetical protein